MSATDWTVAIVIGLLALSAIYGFFLKIKG